MFRFVVLPCFDSVLTVPMYKTLRGLDLHENYGVLKELQQTTVSCFLANEFENVSSISSNVVIGNLSIVDMFYSSGRFLLIPLEYL